MHYLFKNNEFFLGCNYWASHFSDNPYVGITEHPENGETKAVLVNYRPEKQTVNLTVNGLKIKEIVGNVTADKNKITLPANEGAVVKFEEA